jgi:hypothetical protein
MKTQTLRLSLIAIAVIATIGVTTITLLSLQNNIEKQNQEEKIQARVHAFTYNGTKYVKINDLTPNSSIIFPYPYTGNATIDISAYHRWELIRLPKDLGGDKDDISSFRAYSMIDITHQCLTVYRQNIERLEEPCNNDEYEPVNGIAIVGIATYQKYNALPNLDLGVDDQGYIYVKQPVFEYQKNGLIGAGRDVFHCTDPEQTNLQYDKDRLATRQQIESILLSDARIQKIILGNSCEFMGDSILYTENGTYRDINVNLNNTEELSAAVHLQNRSVVSYDLNHLSRTYPAQ